MPKGGMKLVILVPLPAATFLNTEEWRCDSQPMEAQLETLFKNFIYATSPYNNH
jgi:hypothetical protein